MSRLRWCGARIGMALAVTLGVSACDHQPPAVGNAVPAQTAAAPAAPAPLLAPQNLAPAAPSKPMILPGTGVLLRAPSDAATDPVVGNADISLNFVDADIREVAHAVLGDLLHLNYAIDGKLQATVTVQTSHALTRAEVLPAFSQVLHAAGLTLVEAAGIYRIVPVDDASRAGTPAILLGQGDKGAPGARARYEVHVLPLKFVSAAEMRRTLEPYLPKGAALELDTTRNLLILSGTGQDLRSILDMVSSFDVDLLAGMSFGIYPLDSGTPRDMIRELDTIFGPGGSVPSQGLLHFAPLEAMNAVLVVSPQRSAIDEAGRWIARLEKGEDDAQPRVFEYYVQNSRAADLAKVLSQLLSSGEVQTVQPPSAAAKPSIQISAGAQAVNPTGMPAPGLAGLGGAPSTAAPQITTTPAASSPDNSATPAQPSLTGALQAALGAAAGDDLPQLPKVRIVADEKNNALLVYARAADYRIIEDAIKKLDVVPLQVLIEATIAEVTLNNDLQYGLQWFFSRGANKLELSNGKSGLNIPADIGPAFPGFSYTLAFANTNVVLSALAQLTHVNVISSPQLLVLDHQTAALQVGDQVPVITQTAQSTVTSDSPIVNTVQYLNTGVILQVTPRVNSSGLVNLDIDQAVSDVSTTTTSSIDSPTITQRRIVTSAIVEDGETIALGGLILDNQTDNRSGVPLLSSIPVLGPLFSTATRNHDRTELLVLLTPKIIRNASQARIMTDELRRRLESIGALDLRPH